MITCTTLEEVRQHLTDFDFRLDTSAFESNETLAMAGFDIKAMDCVHYDRSSCRLELRFREDGKVVTVSYKAQGAYPYQIYAYHIYAEAS